MVEDIFRVSKNPTRAKSLMNLALDRLEDIKKETKIYKIIEQYYEIIKELITALMYIEGLKTLSHKALITFLERHYSKEFTKDEFILIDETRVLRNDIMYYGKNVDRIFLVSKEVQLKGIIKKLTSIVNTILIK
jgi:uncharacterized protein (UPF0332 family)